MSVMELMKAVKHHLHLPLPSSLPSADPLAWHIDVAGRDGLWRCVMSDVQLSVIVADLLAAHTGAFNVKLRVCLIRLDFSVFVLQPPSCLVCLAVLCC